MKNIFSQYENISASKYTIIVSDEHSFLYSLNICCLCVINFDLKT